VLFWPIVILSYCKQVFSELGTQVLDAFFDGYNACVLAYGQSGTGKTYTMMGSNVEPGIAPRLCSAIFERMTSSSNFNQLTSFRIDVRFDIYKEYNFEFYDELYLIIYRLSALWKFTMKKYEICSTIN